jgi:hypothetical protein
LFLLLMTAHRYLFVIAIVLFVDCLVVKRWKNKKIIIIPSYFAASIFSFPECHLLFDYI